MLMLFNRRDISLRRTSTTEDPARLFYLPHTVPFGRDTTTTTTALLPMNNTTIERSVWGASTDELKERFRSYLQDLAANDDGYRAELINRLEWCFERWNYWREKFYPETHAPLKFPFFKASKGGSEFGHYATIGDSGEPSVIHIKRAYLMGERDITLAKLSATQKLVLKADHPDRLEVVDLTILHELVHQYLHEGAAPATRHKYETSEVGDRYYKGHGKLFRDECNRINQILHAERGFDYVPVRHSKKTHETAANRLRPSCAQFTKSDLFFCWDHTSEDLTTAQVEENHQRMLQALSLFGADAQGEGGAIEIVAEAVQEDTDFPAPYAADCAEVCINKLTEWDEAKKTDLVRDFHVAALRHMQELGALDELLAAVGFSAASSDISPASGENDPEPTVPSDGDTTEFKVGDWVHVDGYDEVTRFQVVQTEGSQLHLTREGKGKWLGPVSDGEVKPANASGATAAAFKVGDYVHHPTFGNCEVAKTFGPTDTDAQNIAIETRNGPKIVSSSSVLPCKVEAKINRYGVKENSVTPIKPVPTVGDDTPLWLEAVIQNHAEDVPLGVCVQNVIGAYFDWEKPDRKSGFHSRVAEVYGVSREACRQQMVKAIESRKQLIGAA